jgi:predicted nuclease of predicted toxin-antitoxin system
MRILLDECVPYLLRRFLGTHATRSVQDVGWRSLDDAVLLRLASGRFDVFVTVDSSLPFEHDLSGLPFGVVVLAGRRGPQRTLSAAFERVREAVHSVRPGTHVVVRIADAG